MTRVILGANIAQVDAPSGIRYTAGSGGGLFETAPRDAKAIVAMGGAIASLAGTARRRTGYRCAACGFGSYLRRCSRCGGDCDRE